MAVAKSPSAGLEDRLALISQMLEEAVVLLRSTMHEVKEGERPEEREDPPEQRPH